MILSFYKSSFLFSIGLFLFVLEKGFFVLIKLLAVTRSIEIISSQLMTWAMRSESHYY